MWAIARIDMGLSDDEFGALTPYQFEALLEQLNARRVRQELLNGIVASTVANTGFRAPEEAATPADFMPSELEHADEEPERMSAEVFVAAMKDVFLRAEKDGKVHNASPAMSSNSH
jgi:hypothetical protein